MPVPGLLTSAGCGALLGMRHALGPDQLAAVSTLVSGERSSGKGAFGLTRRFVKPSPCSSKSKTGD